MKSIVGTILPTVTRYFFQCSTPCGAGFRQRKVKCIMIDEDGITKDLSDEHCAMLQKPPEKEKCDASRICLTPGIQRHKPLRIKKTLKIQTKFFLRTPILIQDDSHSVMVLPAAYKCSALQKVLTSLTGAICHGLRKCEI